MTPALPMNEFRALIESSGFDFDDRTLRRLASYLELLMHWNRAMNLVGARKWRDAFDLILDSLHLARFLEQNKLPSPTDPETIPQIWDLGSGAGLPGLPLRMIWTQGEYWMVESREKRALFLTTVLAHIPLVRTHIYHGRAETFMSGPPPRTADLVVSRAFMPWPQVLELVEPSLNPGGGVVLLLRQPLESAVEGWKITASATYAPSRAFSALTKKDK